METGTVTSDSLIHYSPTADELKFSMGAENETAVTEFILAGFSGLDQRLQLFISLVLLLLYLTTVMGKATIIFLVCVYHRLQTPMYFFISNLAFLEIWFTSSTSIKLFENHLTKQLLAQSCFYFALGCTELVLLVVMSFDRYVAICQPLRYAAIMKLQLCVHLVIAAWHLVLLYKLTFCGSNEIHHFFGDNSPLFNLSCSDTSLLWKIESVLLSCLILGSLCFTLAFYMGILFCILHLPAASGRKKSFYYMFFPSHHLGHCIWELHCSLCASFRGCFLGDKQNCSFAEHCPVPILKSKQDCDTGPERSRCNNTAFPLIMMHFWTAIPMSCYHMLNNTNAYGQSPAFVHIKHGESCLLWVMDTHVQLHSAQELQQRGSHNQCANQVPSAALSGLLANVSLKAHIPAMSRGLSYQLLPKEVTSQSLSQPCSCCWPINSKDRSDLTATFTATCLLLCHETLKHS
ncbi:hypothetical protein QYF61_021346 [Mycteria americana]|uniref:G-protein coupled receptors family 1 profile domain-containing protein n=1 Tax=Mycteria americana TaxID=33587 RepID=A0AAN7RKI3_MYCAM|nr:hypothetical protein QYF61_021346 [Mycteria americana]